MRRLWNRCGVTFTVMLTLFSVVFGMTPVSADQGAAGNRYVQVTGQPGTANGVELAKGTFDNTIGGGSRAFLATPGGFTQGVCDRALALSNPDGQCATTASSGQLFSDINHDGKTEGAEATIPEGGWFYGSFRNGIVTIKRQNGSDIALNIQPPSGEWVDTLLVIRGYYPNAQVSDRNARVWMDSFDPGNNWFAQIRSPRSGVNVAFVSQGWFQQQLDTAFGSNPIYGGSDTNCGDSGCHVAIVVYADINTGAVGIFRLSAPKGPWEVLYLNYDP